MSKEVTSRLPGRIMAVDPGESRHGVALSDPTRLLAWPYGVVLRRSRQQDFEQFAAIAASEGVTQLLVGLPQAIHEPDTPFTAWVRDYAASLSRHLDLPLSFIDESFSTVDASSALESQGKRRWQRQREHIDAAAAAIILQQYLDQQRHEPGV
jgi:putative Holliday junction resolvase